MTDKVTSRCTPPIHTDSKIDITSIIGPPPVTDMFTVNGTYTVGFPEAGQAVPGGSTPHVKCVVYYNLMVGTMTRVNPNTASTGAGTTWNASFDLSMVRDRQDNLMLVVATLFDATETMEVAVPVAQVVYHQ
jgi:hypothetical protein